MQREGTTQIVMSEPKRRFFSGDSLQQALVQAANHFHLQPEEIAYHTIEKRHGFVKVRRKVVIEVDPDAPKKEPAAPDAEVPAAAAVVPAPRAPADAGAPTAPGSGRRPAAGGAAQGREGGRSRGRRGRGHGSGRGAGRGA